MVHNRYLNNERFSIRNILKQDKYDIHNLIEAVNQADNLAYSLTEEWLEYVVETVGEDIFVGICEDKVVGLSTCMINQTHKHQAVINIVVHPTYRNHGVGNTLYDMASSHAQAKKVHYLEAYIKKRMQLSVEFATKRGFKPYLFSWQMELEIPKKLYSPRISNMDYTIFRKATLSDSKAYVAIVNACFGEAVADDALEHVLKDPSVHVYLLKIQDRIIGTATIQTRSNISVGYLYDIAIISEYRGQGLGEFMLKQCMNQLKTQNINKASLLVMGENKNALKLYQRVGFKEADTDIVFGKWLNANI